LRYSDWITEQLLERRELNPDGVYFFGRGDSKDLVELEALLQRLREGGGGVSAVFTETPSNPMLKTPDIYRYNKRVQSGDL